MLLAYCFDWSYRSKSLIGSHKHKTAWLISSIVVRLAKPLDVRPYPSWLSMYFFFTTRKMLRLARERESWCCWGGVVGMASSALLVCLLSLSSTERISAGNGGILYDARIYVQVSFLYQVRRGHSLGHALTWTLSRHFFVFRDIYVLGMLLHACCFDWSYRSKSLSNNY